LFGCKPNKKDENKIQEGEGEGQSDEACLLSPTLSSIVPLEEREQAPLAFGAEFCPTPDGPLIRRLFLELRGNW